MTRYLLDTNIISHLFRNPGGVIDASLRERAGEEIGTSLVVKAEILYGLEKHGALRAARHLERLLDAITVWPIEEPTERCYARLRAETERGGNPLGTNDLWIAAQSVALDAVVVTDDRAFLRVPGLKIENWLRPEGAA